MVTVANIVKKYLQKHSFLEEALSRGLINVAALSEELIPKIEKELGKKVKHSAVNMAVRRYGETLYEKFSRETKFFTDDSDITVRSGVVEITLFKKDKTNQQLRQIYEIIDAGKNLLTITQGITETTIITNKRNEDKIKNIFDKGLIKKINRNLSSITVNIPESSAKIPGLLHHVTRHLAWENINIVEIVSTFSELTIIVEEKDTSRTFDVLKKVVEE